MRYFILLVCLLALVVRVQAELRLEVLGVQAGDSTIIQPAELLGQTDLFQPLSAAVHLPLQTQTDYYLLLRISNPQEEPEEVYLKSGNWAHINLYSEEDGRLIVRRAGRFTPLSERVKFRPLRAIPLRIRANDTLTFVLHLREEMNFYDHQQFDIQLVPRVEAQQETENMLLYQGIFLGVILVMALYNLSIFFAVRDSSFLYYVLSILGLGLYFMFYYGFSLELLWPAFPLFNAYSFALIVPLTRVSWIVFTQKYLSVSQTLPGWQPVLHWLMALYILPIGMGLLSWQTSIDLTDLTVSLIALLGIVVLSTMLILGVLAWRANYRPARYFVLANLFFSLGSILFIFRETGWLPDNALTRYASQVGVIIQVVLFSLGLGNRLNDARNALVEKELEKKRLIESQNALLELEVAQRTTDLKEKTEELELAVVQLRQLNRLKDHLFSVISHDLRTPLTSLSSLLHLLTRFSDRLSAEEKQELVANTQKTLKNVLHLLENLLNWARSQMNTMSFSPEPIQLAGLSEEALELFSPQIKQKKLTALIHVSPRLEVEADRQMLASVLRNLILNAIKFTPQGGRIEVRASQEGQSITVGVRDSGVGISPEKQAKLFSPAEHVSTTGTRNEQGTGLGLLLCKEFVEKHGGTIQVISQPEEGTEVRFTIPKKVIA